MTSGELVELNREIEAKRRSCRRHGIWALLGVSPAALLPILGLAVDFGGGVALAACVFVSGLESWRAVQAHADLKEAQEARSRLLSPPNGDDGRGSEAGCAPGPGSFD